jgi:hypothetical protein
MAQRARRHGATRWLSAVLAATVCSSATAPVRAALLSDGRIDTGTPCVGTNRYTRADSLIFHTGQIAAVYGLVAWRGTPCIPEFCSCAQQL